MPRDALSSRLPAPPARSGFAPREFPKSSLCVSPRHSTPSERYPANSTEFQRWRDALQSARPSFQLPAQPLFRYDASSVPRKHFGVSVEVTEAETRGQPKARASAKCATVSYRIRGSTNGNYFQLAWESPW